MGVLHDDPPEFAYVIEPLPPSPVGRRWRWQLFRGDRLLAGGWQFGERGALRSLRTAASRAAHERAGLRALRPERTHVEGVFLAGATVRVDCGAVTCVLAPREGGLSAAA